MKKMLQQTKMLTTSLALALCLMFGQQTYAVVTVDNVSAALQQGSFDLKAQALNALIAQAQGQAGDTALQNAYGTGLVQLFSQRQGQNSTVLKTVLVNASAATSTLLNDVQKKYVQTQMITALGQQAATPAPAAAAVASSTAPTTQAGSTDVESLIATARAQEDITKKIEGLYSVLQQADGNNFSPGIQKAYATSLVESFNGVRTTQSYMLQLLQGAIESPLLNETQRNYVANTMIPGLEFDAPDAPEAPAVQQQAPTAVTNTTGIPQAGTTAAAATVTPVTAGIPQAVASNTGIPQSGTTAQAATVMPIEGNTSGNKKAHAKKLRNKLKSLKKKLKKAKGNKKKKIKKQISKIRKQLKKIKSKKSSNKKNKKPKKKSKKSKKKSKKKKSKKKKKKRKKKKKKKK